MLNATLSQREGETSAFLCDSKSVKYIHQIFRFGKETFLRGSNSSSSSSLSIFYRISLLTLLPVVRIGLLIFIVLY